MIDLRLVKIVVIVKVHRSHWDITVLILPHPVIAVLAFKRLRLFSMALIIAKSAMRRNYASFNWSYFYRSFCQAPSLL